jgi:hypothetical protein
MSRPSDLIATPWEFSTARFRVALEIYPEDFAPDFDDDGETAADIEAGKIEWFCACVAVYLDGREVARDYLGGCAYESFQQFATMHRDPDPLNRNSSIMREARGAICHYFPDMVSGAISEARKALRNMPELRA